MEEPAEAKKSVVPQSDLTGGVSRLEVLERELQKAKKSERETLALLVSQSKQLEETKAALEEAKLENMSLQEKIKSTDSFSLFGSRSYRNLGNCILQNLSTYMVQAEEVELLRNELRFAAEAEGKSQKAMDDLATALKEVLTEASQLKGSLLAAQSELEQLKAEAEGKGSMFKSMEVKFHAALEECNKLKNEIEESSAAWSAKEARFVNCMRASEEEISKVKSENDELLQSQGAVVEENARLRDALKQSAIEANAAKNDLEHARKENAQLKDLLSAKQECDCLKINEQDAAADNGAKELNVSLAAASNLYSCKLSGSPESEFLWDEESRRLPESTSSKGRVSSERWDIKNQRLHGGHRHSIGESTGSVFVDAAGSPKHKGRSISNIFSPRAAYAAMDDADPSASDGFDDARAAFTGGGGEQTNYMGRKKRTLLWRFRDMLLRRKSVQEKRR